MRPAAAIGPAQTLIARRFIDMLDRAIGQPMHGKFIGGPAQRAVRTLTLHRKAGEDDIDLERKTGNFLGGIGQAKSWHRFADGYKTRWTFTDKATRCGTPTPTKPTQECRVYDSTGVCRTPEEQAEHEAWINDQVEEADRIAKEHACPDGLYWYEDDQACR